MTLYDWSVYWCSVRDTISSWITQATYTHVWIIGFIISDIKHDRCTLKFEYIQTVL
jgi:hypothetical protein